MKKFHFALEPLLEQRRLIETQCAAAAASAQSDLETAETQLRTTEAYLFVILRSTQGAPFDKPRINCLEGRGAALTASDLQAMDSVQSRITQTETTIKHLREAVAKAQTELQRVARERKIVERLRDQRLKTHRENQIRAEQRDIEESNQCRPSGSIMFSLSSS